VAKGKIHIQTGLENIENGFKEKLQFLIVIILARKKENHGLQGMTFGAMDALINVLGIIVGLGVIGNRAVVVIGLLVAGIANSLGNAAGFHVSEETEGIHTRREVWMSTILSFAGTFIVTLLLVIPILFLNLHQAIVSSILLGMVVIVLVGSFIGKRFKYGRKGTFKLICEYLVLSFVVIVIAFYLGQFAAQMLGGFM
jgi:hypothetical protein